MILLQLLFASKGSGCEAVPWPVVQIVAENWPWATEMYTDRMSISISVPDTTPRRLIKTVSEYFYSLLAARAWYSVIKLVRRTS